MRIGQNPNLPDRMRLDFFRAVAEQAVKDIKDLEAENTDEIGAPLARMAAMYRAEGYCAMAELLEPHESFMDLLRFRLHEQFSKNVTERDHALLAQFFKTERVALERKANAAAALTKKWRADKKARTAGAAA
jgi:hypothetical protein